MSEMSIVVRVDGQSQPRTVALGSTAGDLFVDDRAVLVARVGGQLRDLTHVLGDGDVVEPVTAACDEGLAVLRHSSAHVLAQAVQEAVPEASWASARRSRTASTTTSTSSALHPRRPEAIEKRHAPDRQGRASVLRRRVVTDDEARDELSDEPYKLELIGLKGGAGGDDEGASVEVGGGELTIYDNLRPGTGGGAGRTCAAARTCPRPG